MKQETYKVWREDKDGDRHLNGTFTEVAKAERCVKRVKEFHGSGAKVVVEPPLPGRPEKKPVVRKGKKKAEPVQEAVA